MTSKIKRIGFPLAGRPGSNKNAQDARPGGADVSTLTLAKSLADAGFDPIILLHIDGPMAAYVRAAGLKCEVLGLPVFDKRKPLLDENIELLRLESPRIAQILRHNEIEIVHTNDAAMHRAWGHLAQHIDFKHFWHERGLFQHPAASIEHMKRAAEVLTISNYVATRAPVEVRSRIHIIDNPISVPDSLDKEADRRWLRNSLRVSDEAQVFVMVANENRRKRWEIFMEAAAKAARKSENMHFCTVGLTQKQYLRELMDLWPAGARDQIHNLGYRYDATRIISGADVLVATAKQEPLGRTVVEAVLTQTPVLAARSGGFIELFESKASHYLVAPDTVKEFERRFIDAREAMKESESRLNELRAYFKGRFNLDRHLAAMMQIYKKHGAL